MLRHDKLSCQFFVSNLVVILVAILLAKAILASPSYITTKLPSFETVAIKTALLLSLLWSIGRRV